MSDGEELGIRGVKIEPSILIEVRDLDAGQRCMTFLKETGIYPYECVYRKGKGDYE